MSSLIPRLAVVPLLAGSMTAVVCEFAFATPAFTQADTLWVHHSTSKVELAQLSPVGGLLLSTKDGLRALDQETGETTWQRRGLSIPGAGLRTQPFSEQAVVWGKQSFRILDVNTGLLNSAEGDFPPVEELRGYFSISSKQLLLVFAKTSVSKSTLFGVELPSQIVRWRQDSLFTREPKFGQVDGVRSIKEFQWPVVDSDTSLVLYVSKDGPIRLDLRTGELMWRADALREQSVPEVLEGAAQMMLEDGVLYVPYEKHLAAIRVDDGAVLWNRSEEFRAPVSQMESTEYGLVVRGKDKFINVIDRETGESHWPEDFRKLKNTTPFVRLGDEVYVAADKRIVGLQLTSGDSLHSTPFEFKGGEVPEIIERIDDAIFVASTQNFLLSIPSDGVAYHEYYKAPGQSFLAKLAVVALAAGASLASPNYNYVPQGGFKRFARAKIALQYIYVLTERPTPDRKGFSLVRLRKHDGSEAGRVWFRDRSPSYVLDTITSTVYELPDDHTVIARRFPEVR